MPARSSSRISKPGRVRRWGQVAALLMALGCSRSAEPGMVAPGAPVLHRGPLVDFVPAAGLRWLMVGNPRLVAEQPALRGVRERWLTARRLNAFASATGVDLRRTQQALVAGYDLGELYMADGSGWVRAPEQPFLERLAGSGRVERTQRELWRITGLVGSTPQSLVRVDDHLVAVAVGDPMLARVVELRAQGRLRQLVPAFQGAALSVLPAEFLVPGPFCAYALGPLDHLPFARGHGMFSAALAAALALELEQEVLKVRLVVAGAWERERDGQHLPELWRALAESSLGQMLGLDQPLGPVSANAAAEYLTLEARLDARRLFSGLEMLAGGNVERLLDVGAASVPRPVH